MITPAFSAPEGFKNDLHPLEEGETYWFVFSRDLLLVGEDKASLPTSHDFSLQRTLYLGRWQGKHLFAAEVESNTTAPHGWFWSELHPLYASFSEEFYSIAGRARQLIHWDRTHSYCGVCGTATFTRSHERCKECSGCGHLFYPKMAPAVMALVKRGDKILLARSPHFPSKMYSVVAGFVDPGETLEQCVLREVREEVGIEVRNIQYFASQPWPFSYSLMIAFTCDWKEGEIVMDPSEIEEAGWFDHEHLPELPPKLSLARNLIDSFLCAF